MDRAGVPGRVRRLSIPALLLLAAALAGTIALELRSQPTDDSAMPAIQPRPPVPAASGAILAGSGGAEAMAAILARPLFAPDRRPPSAGTAAAPPPPAPLPRVTGILIEGDRRSVIFAAAADGARPLVVGEGGQVNGFRVQSIKAGEVTLMGPDGARTLRPSFDARAPAAAAAAAPGPVPPNLDSLTGIPGLPPLPGLPARPNAR